MIARVLSALNNYARCVEIFNHLSEIFLQYTQLNDESRRLHLRKQIEQKEKGLTQSKEKWKKSKQDLSSNLQISLEQKLEINEQKVAARRVILMFDNFKRMLDTEPDRISETEKKAKGIFKGFLEYYKNVLPDLWYELNQKWEAVREVYKRKISNKNLLSLLELKAILLPTQADQRPRQFIISPFSSTGCKCEDLQQQANLYHSNLTEKLKILAGIQLQMIYQDSSLLKRNKKLLLSEIMSLDLIFDKYKFGKLLSHTDLQELNKCRQLAEARETLYEFNILECELQNIDKLSNENKNIEKLAKNSIEQFVNLLIKYGELPYSLYQELSSKWKSVLFKHSISHPDVLPWSLPDLSELSQLIGIPPFLVAHDREMFDKFIDSPHTKRLKFLTQQTSSLTKADSDPFLLILAPMIYTQGNTPTINTVKSLCEQHNINPSDLCVINCVEDSKMEQVGNAKPATEEDWRKKGFSNVSQLNIANRTFLIPCGYNIGNQELFKPFTVSDLMKIAETINKSASLVYCSAAKSRSVVIAAAALFKRCWDNKREFIDRETKKIKFRSISSIIKHLHILRPGSTKNAIQKFSNAGQSLTLLLFCWRVVNTNLDGINDWLDHDNFVHDVKITIKKLIAPSPVEKQLLALPECVNDIKNFANILNKFSEDKLYELLVETLQGQNYCHFLTKLFEIIGTGKPSEEVRKLLTKTLSILIKDPKNACYTLISMYQAVQGDELVFAIQLAHIYFGLSFKEQWIFENEIIPQINGNKITGIIYDIFKDAIKPHKLQPQDTDNSVCSYIGKSIKDQMIFVNSPIKEAARNLANNLFRMELISNSDLPSVSKQLETLLGLIEGKPDDEQIELYLQSYKSIMTQMILSYGKKLQEDKQYELLHRIVIDCINIIFPCDFEFIDISKEKLLRDLLYFQISEEYYTDITSHLLELSDTRTIETAFKRAMESFTKKESFDETSDDYEKFKKELKCKLLVAEQLSYYQNVKNRFFPDIQIETSDMQTQITLLLHMHLAVIVISEIGDAGIPLDDNAKCTTVDLLYTEIHSNADFNDNTSFQTALSSVDLANIRRQLFQNIASSVNQNLANGNKVNDQQLKLLQALIEKGNYEASDTQLVEQLFENLVVDISEHPPGSESERGLAKILFEKVLYSESEQDLTMGLSEKVFYGSLVKSNLFVTPQATLSMNKVQNEDAWSAIFYCLYISIKFVRQIANSEDGILSKNAERMIETYKDKMGGMQSTILRGNAKENIKSLHRELIVSIIKMINHKTYYLFIIQQEEVNNHIVVNVAIDLRNYNFLKEICDSLYKFLIKFAEKAPVFFSSSLIQDAWNEETKDFRENPCNIPIEVIGTFCKSMDNFNRVGDIGGNIAPAVPESYLAPLGLFRNARDNYLRILQPNDLMLWWQEIISFTFETFNPAFESNSTAIMMYVVRDLKKRNNDLKELEQKVQKLEDEEQISRQEEITKKRKEITTLKEESIRLNLMLLSHDCSSLENSITGNRHCDSPVPNKKLEKSEISEISNNSLIIDYHKLLKDFLTLDYQQYDSFYLSYFLSFILTLCRFGGIDVFNKSENADLTNKIFDLFSLMIERFNNSEQYCAAFLADQFIKNYQIVGKELQERIIVILSSKNDLVKDKSCDLIQELDQKIYEILKLNTSLNSEINQNICKLNRDIQTLFLKLVRDDDRKQLNSLNEIFENSMSRNNYSCEMLRKKFVVVADKFPIINKYDLEDDLLNKICNYQIQLLKLKADFKYLDAQYSELKKRIFQIKKTVIQYQHYIYCKLWNEPHRNLVIIKTKLHEVYRQMSIPLGQETLGTTADPSGSSKDTQSHIRLVKSLIYDNTTKFPLFKDFLNECLNIEDANPLAEKLLHILYMVLTDMLLPRNHLELYLKILKNIPTTFSDEIKNGLKKFFKEKFIEVTKKISTSQDKNTALQDTSIGVLCDIINDDKSQPEKLKMLLMLADNNCVEYYVATLTNPKEKSTILSQSLEIINGWVPNEKMPIIEDWFTQEYISMDDFARVVTPEYFLKYLKRNRRRISEAYDILKHWLMNNDTYTLLQDLLESADESNEIIKCVIAKFGPDEKVCSQAMDLIAKRHQQESEYITREQFKNVVSEEYFTKYCDDELRKANSEFTEEINRLIDNKLSDLQLDENSPSNEYSRFLLEILKGINTEIEDHEAKRVFFKKLIANWTLLIPNCGDHLNELYNKINEQTDALEQNTSNDDCILSKEIQDNIYKLYTQVKIYFTIIAIIALSQNPNILQIESLKDLEIKISDSDLNKIQDKFSNVIARIISYDELPIKTRYDVCKSIIEACAIDEKGIKILEVVNSHTSLQGSQASTRRLKSIITNVVEEVYPQHQSHIKSPRKIISNISNSLSPTRVRTVKRIDNIDVKLEQLKALSSTANLNDKLAIKIVSKIHEQKNFSSETKEKIINCLYDLIKSHAFEGLQLYQLYGKIQSAMDKLFKASSSLYMSIQLTLKIIADLLLSKSQNDFDSISVLLCGIEFCCHDSECLGLHFYFANKIYEWMSKQRRENDKREPNQGKIVTVEKENDIELFSVIFSQLRLVNRHCFSFHLIKCLEHITELMTKTDSRILASCIFTIWASIREQMKFEIEINLELLEQEKTDQEKAKKLSDSLEQFENDNSLDDLIKWTDDVKEHNYRNIFIILNRSYLITYKLIFKLQEQFRNLKTAENFLQVIYWAKADIEACRREFNAQSEEDQYRDDLQEKCANQQQLIELVKQEFIVKASAAIRSRNFKRAFELLLEYQAISKKCVDEVIANVHNNQISLVELTFYSLQELAKCGEDEWEKYYRIVLYSLKNIEEITNSNDKRYLGKKCTDSISHEFTIIKSTLNESRWLIHGIDEIGKLFQNQQHDQITDETCNRKANIVKKILDEIIATKVTTEKTDLLSVLTMKIFVSCFEEIKDLNNAELNNHLDYRDLGNIVLYIGKTRFDVSVINNIEVFRQKLDEAKISNPQLQNILLFLIKGFKYSLLHFCSWIQSILMGCSLYCELTSGDPEFRINSLLNNEHTIKLMLPHNVRESPDPASTELYTANLEITLKIITHGDNLILKFTPIFMNFNFEVKHQEIVNRIKKVFPYLQVSAKENNTWIFSAQAKDLESVPICNSAANHTAQANLTAHTGLFAKTEPRSNQDESPVNLNTPPQP